jgi:hypothetical protein
MPVLIFIGNLLDLLLVSVNSLASIVPQNS